jgi:hypothetical protein
MRRLDESLTRLAERGQAAGPDTLIERVEQRLMAGEDTIVVAFDPRRTDMQTKEQTTPTRRTSGPWLAAAAFGVLAVVAIVAAVALQLTKEESLVAGQPPGALEDFVAALQANDTEAAIAVAAPGAEDGFVHWQVALDTSDLEFTDCQPVGDITVRCTTTFGPSYFYTRLAGEPLVTTFTASIRDGRFVPAPQWPPPEGLVAAERAFEAWVAESHPERYDEMFSEYSLLAHIKFTEASGAARTELAEEYLASR